MFYGFCNSFVGKWIKNKLYAKNILQHLSQNQFLQAFVQTVSNQNNYTFFLNYSHMKIYIRIL